MLHRDLAALDAEPLTSGVRWLLPALVAAAAISAALLLWMTGEPRIAGMVVLGGLVVVAALSLLERRSRSIVLARPVEMPDFAMVGSALAIAVDAAVLTDGTGQVVMANSPYRERFEGVPGPMALGVSDDARDLLATARSMASRDGAGCVTGIETADGRVAVEVQRVGAGGNFLLWRFPRAVQPDLLTLAAQRVAGATGENLANAGVLAALIDSEGRLLAANKPFTDRALGRGQSEENLRFTDLVEDSDDGQLRLLAEGENARPMRSVHVPLDPTQEGGAGTFMMFDTLESGSLSTAGNVQVLLELLPLGLALVDRDGRFLTMNKAFRTAGGIKGEKMPSYPGDL